MTKTHALRNARKHHPGKIDADVLAMVESGKTITRAEWESMRINSWERWVLTPFLSDEAFIAHTERVLDQIPRRPWSPPVAYDDVAAQLLLPAALDRLRRSDMEKMAQVGEEG